MVCCFVDESFLGAKIEQLWIFREKQNDVVTETPQWCQGTVVAVMKRNNVHIEWDDNCLRSGDEKITKQTLLKTRYNKHIESAWRMNLGSA